jgi:glycosyltransferase 2 family protein
VIGIHLLAQPAKYLPGKLGQPAGRAALARRYGITLSAVLPTLAFEAAAGLAAAALTILAALFLGALGAPPRGLPAPVALVASAAAALTAAALWLMRPAWLVRLLRLPPGSARAGRSTARSVRNLGGPLVLYLSVFPLYAAAVAVLARTLFGYGETRFGTLTGTLAAAWLGGFVVPGAPAGLGVREAVLARILAPFQGAELALGLALAFRAVTTLSDGVAFAAGLLTLRGIPEAPAPATGYSPGSSGS